MEFRKMRRSRQQLPDSEAEAILLNGKTGILAVNGEGGYPYAVPVNYVYSDGKIYFHGARAGHRYDAVLRDCRVSFCVIDKDDVVAQELTTYFRSVVVFGKVRVLEDSGEAHDALYKLGMKYYDVPESVEKEISACPAAACYELCPEHITGKEAIELTRMCEK